MATPLFGGSLAPPQQERSFTQKLGRALSGFGAGYAGEGREYLEDIRKQDELQQQKIMGATIQDALELRKALGSNDTSTAMGLLDDRVRLLTDMGQDASDTIALQNELMNGNVPGVIGEVDQFLSGAKRAGYLKPTHVDVKNIYQGQLLSQDPITGELISKPVNPNEDYVDPEELKTERNRIATQAGSVRSIARDALDGYKMLDSLAETVRRAQGSKDDKVRQAGRTALGTIQTLMARMASPGVVTEQDFRTQAGATTLRSEIINKLMSAGESDANIASIMASFDPSNPDLVDVDLIIEQARSLTKGRAEGLLNDYAGLQGAARTYNLSKPFRESWLGGSSARNLTELGKIAHKDFDSKRFLDNAESYLTELTERTAQAMNPQGQGLAAPSLVYASEAEAEAGMDRGEFDFGDTITVGGQTYRVEQ